MSSSNGEGPNVLGLEDAIKKNKEVAYPLLCHNFSNFLSSDQFKNLIGCHGEPKDIVQKQNQYSFINYVEILDESKLRCLMQFATGSRLVPHCGLPFKICSRYLAAK